MRRHSEGPIAMIHPILRVLLAYSVPAFVLSEVLQAQKTASAVQGMVVDQLKQPLAQVEVIARDSASQVVATTLSDSDGTYTLRGLSPNTPYSLLVRRIGFIPSSVTLVTPPADDPQGNSIQWVDFALAQTFPTTLQKVSVTAKANRSIFDRINSAFDRFNEALASFDRTLNRFCHKGDGPHALSLCIDPDNISFGIAKGGVGIGVGIQSKK